jgi:hypothetical protein
LLHELDVPATPPIKIRREIFFWRALLVSIGDAAYRWRRRTRQITELSGLRDIFEQFF